MISSSNFMNGLLLPNVYGFYTPGIVKDPSVPFIRLEGSDISPGVPNNYSSVKVGDGMSTSEKIR